MNMYDLNEIYEMLKSAGYINSDEDSSKGVPEIDPTAGGTSNCCADLNLDVPWGFQDMNPLVFITIGDVIGNILAGNLPFNVAVAISNWLNLVGQVIETYGAQQQYFQSGPGRVYNLMYRNVTNPYCSCNNSSESNPSEAAGDKSSNTEGSTTTKDTENTQNSENDEMKDLQKTIEALKDELNNYKEKVDYLEESINKIKDNSKNL